MKYNGRMVCEDEIIPVEVRVGVRCDGQDDLDVELCFTPRVRAVVRLVPKDHVEVREDEVQRKDM